MRREREWTLAQLARRCGMNATYLSLVERGLNVPSLVTILDLAEALQVEAADIMREVEAGRLGRKPAVPSLPVAPDEVGP